MYQCRMAGSCSNVPSIVSDNSPEYRMSSGESSCDFDNSAFGFGDPVRKTLAYIVRIPCSFRGNSCVSLEVLRNIATVVVYDPHSAHCCRRHWCPVSQAKYPK
ncbi:hypothetical protein CBL_07093 [Carabus blaptoides fortunei]